MSEELSTAVALCTAWERGDLESWGEIARKNGADDSGTVLAMGELSHIAVELARALGAAEGQLEAKEVLSQISLQSLNDGDDGRLELYRGLVRWVAAEPSTESP